MKAYILYLAILTFVLAGALSCGSGNSELDLRQVSLTPLYGSSAQGLQLSQSGSMLYLRIASIPKAGSFLRLNLPVGTSISRESWNGDTGLIHLAIVTAGGTEVGVARTPAYDGSAVLAQFEIAATSRRASIPPLGAGNLISDLQIADAGAGHVSLDWTQTNCGDYDFNGEVNVADLTPLGRHLGESYDRQAPGARSTTLYWIDGDTNGELNISDLSPIGANYRAYIAGYVVQHNGLDILNGQGALPTVLRDQGIPQPGLPPRFSLDIPGLVADSWLVAPQDLQGNVGADSGGNVGSVDLRASLNISGLDLFNLAGAGSGAFGNGKFATRVIDPGDIVDRPNVSSGIPGAIVGSVVVKGLRSAPGYAPGKVYFLDIRYAPVVNLANGAPRSGASFRGGSGAHAASDVPESDIVITSVPFRMPLNDPGAIDITADIDLAPNPAGGYFVNLDTTVTTPGDDPTTLAVVETSYIDHYVCRLDFANALVQGDSDFDGNFDDEAEMDDNDLDCIGSALLVQRLDDEEYEDGEREEVSGEGVVSTFDETTGVLSLTGVLGEGIILPPNMTVMFSQLTTFEERIKSDGEDIIHDIDPSTLSPGDVVEVEFYGLAAIIGGSPDVYWAHKIQRRIGQ